MKRFSILLFIVVIVSAILFAGNVFAAEGIEKKSEGIKFVYPDCEMNSGPLYEALDEYVEDMADFRATLEAGFAECDEEINLYKYKIPAKLENELFYYIFKDIPEAFHVEALGIGFSANNVHTLYVRYDLNQSEYAKLLKQCRDVADKMTEGLDHPGLSEADKALILHDRLAVHNEYDWSLAAPYTFEMVGALVNQTSVCEGYAMAYSFLLDQVGIKNYYCTSEALNHGWNIVYIDGVKYHVDVTWDDPLYEYGWVFHDNFLRSTAGMIETGHKEGVCDFDSTPQDTRYDNAYWRNSYAAFQVLDGKVYYIEGTAWDEAELRRVDSTEHKVVATLGDMWITSEGNWGAGYQALVSDGQDLLFSGNDKIYRYCTELDKVETVWTPVVPAGTAIFGFKYENGHLTCVCYDSVNSLFEPNQTTPLKTSYEPHSHSHEHTYTDACDADCNICGETRNPPHVYDDFSDLICNLCSHERPLYTLGDVDGSGVVDLNDAIYLLYYVNFPAYYSVNQPVDFDGSGMVDLSDAIYLLYYVNFPSSYPLH